MGLQQGCLLHLFQASLHARHQHPQRRTASAMRKSSANLAAQAEWASEGAAAWALGPWATSCCLHAAVLHPAWEVLLKKRQALSEAAALLAHAPVRLSCHAAACWPLTAAVLLLGCVMHTGGRLEWRWLAALAK